MRCSYHPKDKGTCLTCSCRALCPINADYDLEKEHHKLDVVELKTVIDTLSTELKKVTELNNRLGGAWVQAICSLDENDIPFNHVMFREAVEMARKVLRKDMK